MLGNIVQAGENLDWIASHVGPDHDPEGTSDLGNCSVRVRSTA